MGVVARGAERLRRHPHWALIALVVAVALPYALLGVGWVLDDWFALRNARFDGALAAAGHSQWLARPGQGVVYFLTFGLIGEHPLVMYAVQVALAAATAVLLYRLLRVVLDDGPALAVAAVWAIVPNHASLVDWPSAVGIAVALVLLLGGCLSLVAVRDRWTNRLAAALLLTASVLCYEATAPAAAVAAVVLPKLAGRGWRWRQAAASWAGLAGAGVWMVTHVNPAKAVIHTTADFSQLLPAHFGWGVAPKPLAPVVALLGLAALSVLLLDVTGFRGRRMTGNDSLMAAGLAVIALGAVPFARYYYAPLGAGDRANVVAGIGTALAWVGAAGTAFRYRRTLALVATGFVAAAMLVAGVTGSRSWHEAAKSGRRVMAALPSADAGGTLVVGPDPIEVRNVAAFLDDSNIAAAYQLRRGTLTASARMSHAEQDFDRVPAALRVDLRCIPGTVEATRQRCP